MAVTPAEIAVDLGRPTPSASSLQYRQWNLWIGDARRLISNRLGDLSLLNQDDLDFVVRKAVVAAARAGANDGATSKTVAVDDGTVTKRWENGVQTDVAITDAWWDLLIPDSEDHDAYTIQPFKNRVRCP